MSQDKDNTNQTQIQMISSGTEIIKRLPSGESFSVYLLPNYEAILPKQRTFIDFLIDNMLQEKLACMQAGVGRGQLNNWLTDDTAFRETYDTVQEMFTEGLETVDMLDSFSNSKIRGRVIDRRRGKKSEKVVNNLNVFGEGGLHNLKRLFTGG